MIYIVQFKYNNAIININGEPSRERLEDAAIRFIKKMHIHNKNKLKGQNQNGNSSKS